MNLEIGIFDRTDILIRDVYPAGTVVVDLDAVPANMQSDDPITQLEVEASVLNNSRSEVETDIYLQRPRKDMSLSYFKKVRELGNSQLALSFLLNNRTKVVLDEEDQFHHNNPLTFWNATADKRVDYMCTVSSKLGLESILPNRRTSASFEFILDLKPHFAFSGKYAQLGADQSEALFRIGSRPGEEVYIFMCPKEAVDEPDHVPPKPGFCSGSTTRMKAKHSRILSVFIAWILSLMGDNGIYVLDRYNVPQPPNQLKWSQITNAL